MRGDPGSREKRGVRRGREGSQQRVCYQASYSCGQRGRTGPALSCHLRDRKPLVVAGLPWALPAGPSSYLGRESLGELCGRFSAFSWSEHKELWVGRCAMQTEPPGFPRGLGLGGLSQGVRRPCRPRLLIGEQQSLEKVVSSRLMLLILVLRERLEAETKRN